MIKKAWNYIDGKDWTAQKKYKAASLIYGSVFSIIGFVLWLVIRNWALGTPDWMICFIGYPYLISFFAVYFYSLNHSFYNGPRPKK